MIAKSPGQALSAASIDQYWTVNHEHPPVEKVWSGQVWNLARQVFDDLTASQLGVILLVALLVALLYLLVAPATGARLILRSCRYQRASQAGGYNLDRAMDL